MHDACKNCMAWASCVRPQMCEILCQPLDVIWGARGLFQEKKVLPKRKQSSGSQKLPDSILRHMRIPMCSSFHDMSTF